MNKLEEFKNLCATVIDQAKAANREDIVTDVLELLNNANMTLEKGITDLYLFSDFVSNEIEPMTIDIDLDDNVQIDHSIKQINNPSVGGYILSFLIEETKRSEEDKSTICVKSRFIKADNKETILDYAEKNNLLGNVILSHYQIEEFDNFLNSL